MLFFLQIESAIYQFACKQVKITEIYETINGEGGASLTKNFPYERKGVWANDFLAFL